MLRSFFFIIYLVRIIYKDKMRRIGEIKKRRTKRIFSERFWNPAILDLFKLTGSCALNKKGCHFPAVRADPSHTSSLPETSRTISIIFRANFSRLNFDSRAKILGDIIKYDYPGKKMRKEGAARDASKRTGEERTPRRNRKKPQRWEETMVGR